MLERIYEDSNLNSLHVVLHEENSFKGIAIRISGVNGATAVELEDVGRLQYFKGGEALIDADFDMLHSMGHILMGNPFDNSTASGALDYFLYIPRRLFDDNVDHVVPSDNAQIKCTFGANLATRIASGGVVEVYLDRELGIQKYDLVMRQYSETIGGTSTFPWSLSQPNIMMAALSARVSGVLTTVGSNISQITVQVGDQHSDLSLGALVAYTNAIRELEADYLIAALPFVAQGDITAGLQDSIRFTITTSGASTPEMLLVSALFDNARLNMSASQQVQRIRTIVKKKIDMGQLNTVSTLKRLTGKTLA